VGPIGTAERRAVRNRQPPNAVQSRFVPAPGEVSEETVYSVPDPAARPRSARGYPAAVATPAGADPAVVGPYLAKAFGDEKWRSVTVDLIASGLSNLTYVVTPEAGSEDDAVILRRPPTGAVLATAHDMGREHRVISALGPTDVPVPRTLHLCENPAVLGAPFYVMERVVGVHVVREFPPGYADAPEQRRAVGEGLVDVLADLHSVDYAAVGLADFGRPEGFLARQVRRWGGQLDRSRSRPLPGIDDLRAKLAATVPPGATAVRIVHGDYRLDNLIIDPDSGAVAAVLDWEMATLGDPLADLGLLLTYWDALGGGAAGPAGGENPVADGLGEAAGFPSGAELLARYGVAESELAWYVGLGCYKLAVICEGIHYRYTLGQTVGTGFERMGGLVAPLLAHGLRAVDAPRTTEG
jgi:aminoglycoside phosphotransferase (APT) family kinase protein